MTIVFISHDVAVVRQVCDTVAVMLNGELVERLPADSLFTAAHHPYTKKLIEATPDFDRHLADTHRPPFERSHSG